MAHAQVTHIKRYIIWRIELSDALDSVVSMKGFSASHASLYNKLIAFYLIKILYLLYLMTLYGRGLNILTSCIFYNYGVHEKKSRNINSSQNI